MLDDIIAKCEDMAAKCEDMENKITQSIYHVSKVLHDIKLRQVHRIMEPLLIQDVRNLVIEYAMRNLWEYAHRPTFPFHVNPTLLTEWQNVDDTPPKQYLFHHPLYAQKEQAQKEQSETMWIHIDFQSNAIRVTLNEDDLPKVTQYVNKYFLQEIDLKDGPTG